MDHLLSNIGDEIQELIITVLAGQATPQEVQRLKSWIEASKENKSYFNEINHAWQVSASGKENLRFDTEKAWLHSKSKMASQHKADKTKSFSIYRFARIAAIFMLVFALGGLATYFVMRNTMLKTAPPEARMNEIIAPLGSKSQVVLPDGTSVWLNAGSRLQYSQSYNSNHRDVYLVGEAFFKVKTNAKKPFIVKTSEMNVKAYGTAFNVKAYPEEKTITTTLEEGIVTVVSTNKLVKNVEISLKPKQNLVYYKSGKKSNTETEKNSTSNKKAVKSIEAENNELPVKIDAEVNTSLYTSWKDDKWIIESEDLDKLVVMLERRFNVTFEYDANSLKKYRVSGIIRKETLEQVLNVLKLTAPIRYTINKGTVTLEADEIRAINYPKILN